MNNLNPFRKLAVSPRAGCFRVLFLLVIILTANARAGAIFTSLYSFTGTNDGANPYAGLVLASDGNLYGTTSSGGTNNRGTVFKITGAGALTNLYSFTGGEDGGAPWAGLVQASDGSFYGTTELGGSNSLGTVFKISTNGALTSLYSFTGASDGAYPLAGLVQGSDGNLYGTTAGHGPFFYACTIFKISTNGMMTPLYTFTPPWVETPWGLVQGKDGNFYGTTADGGSNNFGLGYGTVFTMATNGNLTNLYLFGGTNDGANPHAGLVLASDGNLYGTTANGGLGYGEVFTVATNGNLTGLYSFGGTNDGANPYAGLVQGRDGNFYGTTKYGGTNNLGTVFRLTIVPVFQSATVTNGARILTWSVEAGGTYQLQYRRDWTSVNWNNLTSPVIATGATLSFTDSSLVDPWRVYRVKLLP